MLGELKKLYELSRPFGRKKLLFTMAVSLIQGLVLMVSVVSFFPFLAVVAKPDSARGSDVVQYLFYFTGELSNERLIMAVGLIAIAMLLISNVVSLLATFVVARFTYGFGRFLRGRMFERIFSREYSYFLKCSPGVVIKKINSDAQNIVTVVFRPLLQVFSGVLNIVALVTALLMLDPLATVVVSIIIGGTYAILFRLFATSRRNYSRVMLQMSRGSNRLVHQAVTAIKPIKIHGVESFFSNRFEAYIGDAARALVKQGVIVALPRSLVEPVGISLLILFVLYSALQGKDLSVILPIVGVFGLASYRILPNIQSLYGSMTTIISNRHLVDEVADELLNDDSWLGNRQQLANLTSRLELTSRVEVRGLSYSYESSSVKVIDRLDYTIEKGRSIAVIGKTGCGKSTFVDLILGLYEPVEGGVFIDGVRLDRTNRRAWLNNIGYVPQDIVLLDDTVVANIALGESEDEIDWELIRDVCVTADILDFIEKELEEGWETVVGDRGVRLSGGQRQRIGLARALYRKPSLLILDEATSALDHETEARVMEGIEKLEGAVTMVIIAHRLSTIKWCDDVLNLGEGSRLLKSEVRRNILLDSE